MNSDIQTAQRPLTHALAKIHAVKPVVTNLMLILPAVFVSFLMWESRVTWPHSQMFMMVIFGLMTLDFLILVMLEPHRQALGKMTIPAMLAFIAITILFTVTEALDRFVINSGFRWLTPLAGLALLVIYSGIFREKNFSIKVFLLINAMALTTLACLGDTSKIALPF
ncbi:MAG: hypothetical protein EPN97_04495 [Alphaproteobacteria bacterium]|nr:MAG: hypothetical protein EPN97_04495 [Alphaproteobacteria bacterium]